MKPRFKIGQVVWCWYQQNRKSYAYRIVIKEVHVVKYRGHRSIKCKTVYVDQDMGGECIDQKYLSATMPKGAHK